MGFLLFLIVVLILFGGVGTSIVKMIGVFLGLVLAGVALCGFFLISSFHSDLKPVQMMASGTTHHSHKSVDDLSKNIQYLRSNLNNTSDPDESFLLMNHLKVLEEIKRQKMNEEDALKRVKKDSFDLREINRARQVIERSKQEIVKQSKKLNDLENKLEKSRRYLNKIIENENIEKGGKSWEEN